jgi:hypothetical protein
MLTELRRWKEKVKQVNIKEFLQVAQIYFSPAPQKKI